MEITSRTTEKLKSSERVEVRSFEKGPEWKVVVVMMGLAMESWLSFERVSMAKKKGKVVRGKWFLDDDGGI